MITWRDYSETDQRCDECLTHINEIGMFKKNTDHRSDQWNWHFKCVPMKDVDNMIRMWSQGNVDDVFDEDSKAKFLETSSHLEILQPKIETYNRHYGYSVCSECHEIIERHTIKLRKPDRSRMYHVFCYPQEIQQANMDLWNYIKELKEDEIIA